MLTTKLILEKLDKEGRVLERREKPSRSFTLQFIDFLYLRHAQTNRATRDIDNTLRTLKYNPVYAQHNLLVASSSGHAGIAHIETNKYRFLEGQDVGIQVGRGDTPVAPTDYKMEDRINHGRCGKSGVTAEFTNPSFEDGDLTGWTEAHSGAMVGSVDNGVWALKDGTWYCTLLSTGSYSLGDYAQISQDIDLTNITHLRFQLRGDASVDNFRFEVLVDGRPIYSKAPSINTDYANQLVDVRAYTGTHTVTFKLIVIDAYVVANNGVFIDNIETIQADPEIEYGGTEVLSPIFSNPNGELTIRRYFTNSSGQSITVNEVGIQAVGEDTGHAGYAFLIAHDIVSPGVEVTDGQILRVTYVPQITV